MYTKIKIKYIYTNLKIVLQHCPCVQTTIAIKLGHAGIADLVQSNLSIPVYKNM